MPRGSMRLARGWWWLLLAWPAAAVLRVAAERSPAGVERLFARGLYPLLAGAVARLTSWTPLSLAEVTGAVVALAAALALVCWIRSVLRADWTRAGASVVRALAVGGAACLLFTVQWGLNYQRQPVAAALGLHAVPRAREELAALAAELVEAANVLRAVQMEDASGVARLRDGVEGALARTGWGLEEVSRTWPVPMVRTRPKAALFSVALSYAGISGIYVPFTGEPHVNALLPESEVPFTASHELAHHAGFAREDEANFLAYLACRLHPDVDFRYSGALRASLYAVSALRRVDPAAAGRVDALRSGAVWRDLAALAAWRERYRSRAGAVQSRVNDAYLRAQGQADGVASYGRMVDLLLAERAARVTAGLPTTPAPP